MRKTKTALPQTRANSHAPRDDAFPAGGLPPDTLRHLAASLKTQWKRYRKKLKRCQKHFSEGAVHASRVETRRLLSLVELLAPFLPSARVKRVEVALKRHRDTFDGLRDTQVQLLTVSRMLDAFPAARAFREYLLEREERFAKQTREDIKRVKTSRLGKWMTACRREVAAERKRRDPQATAALLLRSVGRAFARTRQLRARIDPRDTATIHRTRVAFKKFRYMVETLAAYLPTANRTFLAAMHDYQTMMGDIQDVEVLLRTFDKFRQKQKLEMEPARHFRQTFARRRQVLIRAFLAGSGQLLEFWPPGKAILRNRL